jgi:hypothetical protein
VSFDPEPALASQGRDPPRDDHWRPAKQRSKMDEYFGLFSLNKHDFGLFWNNGGLDIKQVAKKDVISFNGLIISTPYFSR